ncbi:MAG: type II toxin-antitoxin system prevent-host-death family antitoxin [Acidobacteria bacterium]|nr:type II toxin-antitoxin system prevent-host-death family antitoxin [Acidobacteriota bacterium]
MKKIIPITDLQRQIGTLVSGCETSGEPIIITQRGRAAAVLLPVSRYEQIEEDLARLDEFELQAMLQQAEAQIAARQTITHQEVKARLTAQMPKTKAGTRKRRAG